MAKDTGAKREITIELSIPESDYNNLIASNEKYAKQPVTALKTICEQLLSAYSNGGMLIKPHQVKKISELAEKDVLSADDIIELTRNKSGKKNGYTIELSIDPTFLSTFQQAAFVQQVSVEALIAQAWEIAMINEWLYPMPQDTRLVPFDKRSSDAIKHITGKDLPTGKDIVEILEMAAK